MFLVVELCFAHSNSFAATNGIAAKERAATDTWPRNSTFLSAWLATFCVVRVAHPEKLNGIAINRSTGRICFFMMILFVDYSL